MGRFYLAVAVATLLLVAGFPASAAYAGCGDCDKCGGCEKDSCDNKRCTMNSGEYRSIQELVLGSGAHKPIPVECCQRDCFELLCCERGEFKLLCPEPCKPDKCTSCKPKCKQDTCTTCKPKCKQDTCTTCEPKCQKDCCKPKCKPDCAKPCSSTHKCGKCSQDTCTTCKPKCKSGCGKH